jgi:hypothetical protein
MKSFLEILEEDSKTHNPVVMTFGRFNPPTTGHMKLIDKVRDVSEHNNAPHHVFVSHSQDTKKNPLSANQKIKHLKRYSPGTHFEASTSEHPTIFHAAAKLHDAGHDHLKVVAGSDRVKEYQNLLNKYNGVKGPHGYYNFKKIEVVSAGQRDPDSEGAEGMSATKMREHAKNNDFSSFRQGVPDHVSDKHARELMNDTRQGMGLHEDVNHGMFKAIFVTGGPGSGKDLLIREAIPLQRAVELNYTQAIQYLGDKQKLSEKTQDFRRESIRNRGPLIINGPADDLERISYIKEELEELGYGTMMIFVHTSDEVSKERNSYHSRMMAESIRKDRWTLSQNNMNGFNESFNDFLVFENSNPLDSKEEDIHVVYQTTEEFIGNKITNETSSEWLQRRLSSNIFEKKRFDTPGPDDCIPDARPNAGLKGDQIKGNTNPRKNPNGVTYTFGGGAGVYAENAPTVKFNSSPKEPNFQMDNDKKKVRKRGDTSLSAARVGKPSGVGSEYDTRAGGQSAAAGAGLGNQTYSEDRDYNNDDVADFAGMPKGPQPNPLSNDNNTFLKRYKKKLKEYNGFQNDVESGVGGVLGGAGNKEGMDTYKDQNRNIGIDISNKKKKRK